MKPWRTELPDLVWKHLRAVFERMEADAPEGFVPRVQVTLLDGETFEPAVVGNYTSSAWLVFEIDDEGDVLTERRRVIAARPEAIARVEVRFVRADGKRIGFSVNERSAPELTSDAGD